MKQPIKPEDIRKGDLIRWEYENDYTLEMRVDHDGKHPPIATALRYFLLDRQTPPVELPTERTLGWASWSATTKGTFSFLPLAGSGFGEWVDGGRAFKPVASGLGFIPAKRLTAFTPAVAVPKAALDELRRYIRPWDQSDELTPAQRRIFKFLAAVDAANGDER